jgi:polysaccharide biosynthesis protein PslA
LIKAMRAPLEAETLPLRAARPLAPPLERRRVRIYLAMLVADILMILGAYSAVGHFYLDYLGVYFGSQQAQLLLPLYLTLALYQRAYSVQALASPRYAIIHALAALGLAGTLLIFVTFYTKSTESFSRVVFTGGITSSAALITVSRLLLGRWLGRMWGPTVINQLHIEAGGPSVQIRNAIRIDAAEQGLVPDVDDPNALDRIGRTLINMDRVIVSCAFEDRTLWAQVLRAAGVRGEIITDRLSELKPIGLSVEDGWHALQVSVGPLGMRQRVIKRTFDLVLSLAGFILLAPLMLLVALAILIEDGRPVLFVQQRLGRGNRFFSMYKFRSMRAAQTDHDGRRSAARADDRVTRVGRFIRRTSIDELPQLINVVRGDMSLVGPRPHAIASQAGDKLFWRVDGAYWIRHSLKPGVTGLVQIRGYRGATDREEDLQNRLNADLEYISTWSPWGDTKILLRTLGVLVHRQAY